MASSRRYERSGRGRGYDIDDQNDYNISEKRQKLHHDYYEDKQYNTPEEMNRLRDKPSYHGNNHHNMDGWSYSNGDHHHRYLESPVATDPRRQNSIDQRGQELKLLHDEPISNDHHSSHQPYSLGYSDRNRHHYQCRESSVVDDDDSDDGEFSIGEESKHLPDVPHKMSLRPRSQIGYPDTTTTTNNNNNKFSSGTNKDEKNDNANCKIRFKWSSSVEISNCKYNSKRKRMNLWFDSSIYVSKKSLLQSLNEYNKEDNAICIRRKDIHMHTYGNFYITVYTKEVPIASDDLLLRQRVQRKNDGLLYYNDQNSNHDHNIKNHNVNQDHTTKCIQTSSTNHHRLRWSSPLFTLSVKESDKNDEEYISGTKILLCFPGSSNYSREKLTNELHRETKKGFTNGDDDIDFVDARKDGSNWILIAFHNTTAAMLRERIRKYKKGWLVYPDSYDQYAPHHEDEKKQQQKSPPVMVDGDDQKSLSSIRSDILQASTLTPSNRKYFGESSDMEISSDDEEQQDDGVDPSASDTRKGHEGHVNENIMERMASTTARPQMEKYDSISDKDKSAAAAAAAAAFTAKDNPASANNANQTLQLSTNDASFDTTIIASATKKSPDSKVGIKFISKQTSGKVVVSFVNADGLFGSTALREGQEILSINGTNVYGMRANDVARIIKSAESELIIHAAMPTTPCSVFENSELKAKDSNVEKQNHEVEEGQPSSFAEKSPTNSRRFNDVFKFKQIVSHEGPLKYDHPKWQGSMYNVEIEWYNGEVTTEPLNNLAADDPFSCFIYARDHDLLDTPGWRCFKNKCQVCYKPVKATDICSNITCKITQRNINIVKKKRMMNSAVSQTENAQEEVSRQSIGYTNMSASENSSTPGSDAIDKSNTQRSKSSHHHSSDTYSLPTFWPAPTTYRFAGELQTMSEHSGASICKVNCKATAGGDIFTSRKVDHGQFSDVEDDSFADDSKYADASEGASLLPVGRGIGTTTDNKATRYPTNKDAKDDDGDHASPSNDPVLRSQDLNDLLAVLKELAAADGSQADDHTVSTEPHRSTTDQLSASIGNGANQIFQRMEDEPGKQNVELDRLVKAARLATMHFIKSKNDNDRLAKENEVIVEKERKARMELQEQKLASESLRGCMEREKAKRASNENALKEKFKNSIEENVALVNEADNLRQQLQDRQKDLESERNLRALADNATQDRYSKLKADYDALVKKEGNMQLDLQAQQETVELLAQDLDKERSEKNAINERFHQTMQMYEVNLRDANQKLEFHQSQKGVMENRIVKMQGRLQEAIKRAESYRSNNTATEGRLVEMQSQLRNANARAASATAAQSKTEETLNQVHNSWQEQYAELEAKKEEVSQLTLALKREWELRKDSDERYNSVTESLALQTSELAKAQQEKRALEEFLRQGGVKQDER